MSNLGWYQKMTVASKRVGGPKNLLGLAMISGYILGKSIDVGVKKFKMISKDDVSLGWDNMFISFNQYDAEFNYRKGQRFRILAMDNEVALIELEFEKNNPYFVSKEWISKRSVLTKNFKLN